MTQIRPISKKACRGKVIFMRDEREKEKKFCKVLAPCCRLSCPSSGNLNEASKMYLRHRDVGMHGEVVFLN